MNLVQRIMSKIVGEEISAEELEMVAGGLKDACTGSGCKTWDMSGAGNFAVADCQC